MPNEFGHATGQAKLEELRIATIPMGDTVGEMVMEESGEPIDAITFI